MYSQYQLTISRFFLVFVAGLAALGPLSVDAYLPTLQELADDFDVGMAKANLTISFFLIGLGIGQFIGGPLSDQLGRKKIGLIGLLIHIVATALITVSTTLDQVLILRLIQAIGGGFASVICLAQMRDVFPPSEVSEKFANVVIVILVAPMLAPSIGTLTSSFGWQAIFLLLAGYGIFMALLYYLLIPETNHDQATKLSAKALFSGYWAAASKQSNGRLIGLRLALFSGFSGGVLFCYVTNAAFILGDLFSLNKIQFSIAFGFMALAFMAGNRITVRLLKRMEAPIIIDRINLLQLVATGLMIIQCYFITPSLWHVLVGIALILACHGATSPAASGYFIGLYDKNVGSASSLSATLVFSFGGLIGGISALISNGQLMPIFITMFFASAIARLIFKSAKLN